MTPLIGTQLHSRLCLSLYLSKKKKNTEIILFCSDFYEQNKLYTIKGRLYETPTKEDNLVLLRT